MPVKSAVCPSYLDISVLISRNLELSWSAELTLSILNRMKKKNKTRIGHLWKRVMKAGYLVDLWLMINLNHIEPRRSAQPDHVDQGNSSTELQCQCARRFR